MLIECHHPQISKRLEPIEVPIGNEKYLFKDDGTGRRVAEVWIESHVESFLAVPHLYREVKDEDEDEDEEEPETGKTAKTGDGGATMSRKDMMAVLKAANVTFSVTSSNAELVALVAALPPAPAT